MILLSWKSQVRLFLHSQILIAWPHNLFYLIFFRYSFSNYYIRIVFFKRMSMYCILSLDLNSTSLILNSVSCISHTSEL